jgi:hypothetical protein
MQQNEKILLGKDFANLSDKKLKKMAYVMAFSFFVNERKYRKTIKKLAKYRTFAHYAMTYHEFIAGVYHLKTEFKNKRMSIYSLDVRRSYMR